MLMILSYTDNHSLDNTSFTLYSDHVHAVPGIR